MKLKFTTNSGFKLRIINLINLFFFGGGGWGAVGTLDLA